MKPRAKWGPTIADRISWLASHLTMTLKELSTKAGFSENYIAIAISRIRRDPVNRDIGTKLAIGIAKETGCDLTWLLTGEGVPFPGHRSDIRPRSPFDDAPEPPGLAPLPTMPPRRRAAKR